MPLYERDPEAWRVCLAEGNRTQARKRVSADVLFRDEAGRILRSRIRTGDGELTDFRFVAAVEAEGLLRAYVHRRLTAALCAVDRGSTAYLQDGYDPRHRR